MKLPSDAKAVANADNADFSLLRPPSVTMRVPGGAKASLFGLWDRWNITGMADAGCSYSLLNQLTETAR